MEVQWKIQLRGCGGVYGRDYFSIDQGDCLYRNHCGGIWIEEGWDIQASDFYMLSKIIITITLPCATITTFSKNGMDTFVPFAPAASATPAYTGKLGCDVELSSALSSIEILISIVAIVVVLILVL